MGLLCAAPHPGGCPARWPLSLFGPGHHDVQRGAVQRSARPHRAAGLFAQKNILALHTRLSMSANANEAAAHAAGADSIAANTRPLHTLGGGADQKKGNREETVVCEIMRLKRPVHASGRVRRIAKRNSRDKFDLWFFSAELYFHPHRQDPNRNFQPRWGFEVNFFKYDSYRKIKRLCKLSLVLRDQILVG
jgi:hypothetical protein